MLFGPNCYLFHPPLLFCTKPAAFQNRKRRVLFLLSFIFAPSLHTLRFIQNAFSHADIFRSDFNQLILCDELDCLLQAHHLRWNQTQRIVASRSTGVGHVFLFADVDHDVLILRGLTNDHTFVHIYTSADEEGAALLCIVQTVGNSGSGFKRNQIGNDNIKWETTTQTNVGIDFSLFKQSLYGSLEYYYKKTTDILTEMAGGGVLGEGGSRWINSGAMKNQGFEFNLGYRNKTAFGLTYDLNGNISTYRNEILELPETVAANGKFGGNGVKSVVGHTYGAQVGYIADGIFKSQDEVDNHATQEGAAVGRIRYRDIDHNGVIDERDQNWIYDPTPSFSYGLNIYLEYKNFDLTMFWQGIQGVDIISDVKKKSDFWSASNVGFLNKGTRLLNAWSPTNPNSDIPALTRSDTNNEQRVSTYFVENGSFLKLRNIQLGYTVPAVVSKKMRMDRLRFYCSAQNLLTIKSKNFTGEDPENPNFSYPIPVNITFGLNIGF